MRVLSKQTVTMKENMQLNMRRKELQYCLIFSFFIFLSIYSYVYWVDIWLHVRNKDEYVDCIPQWNIFKCREISRYFKTVFEGRKNNGSQNACSKYEDRALVLHRIEKNFVKSSHLSNSTGYYGNAPFLMSLGPDNTQTSCDCTFKLNIIHRINLNNVYLKVFNDKTLNSIQFSKITPFQRPIILYHMPKFANENIFHFYAINGIYFCILSIINSFSQNLSKSPIILISGMKNNKSNLFWGLFPYLPISKNTEILHVHDFISKYFPSFTKNNSFSKNISSTHPNITIYCKSLFRVTSVKFDIPLIHHRFHLDQRLVPPMIRLSTAVRMNVLHNAIGESPLLSEQSYLLIVQRSGRRRLLDARTGTISPILHSLCKASIPFKYVSDLGTLSPQKQVALAAQARGMLSVHGAQLTNMIWMKTDSFVLEVTLRYGWCCDPFPYPASLTRGEPYCSQCNVTVCKPYHKADFSALALAHGLRYAYYDPLYTSCITGANPINRDAVYVNSSDLAMVVTALWLEYEKNHLS